MIFSKYNVYYNKDNEMVVYNTLNKKMIVLPKGLVNFEVPEKNSELVKKLMKDFIVEDSEVVSNKL